MGNKARIFSTFVRIGGQPIAAIDWSFDLHAYSAADECKLTVPLRRTLAAVGDLQALSQKTIPLEVQILGGFTKKPGARDGLKVLFAGPLDCVDADFSGDTYEITGRSWAYQLLAEDTTLVWQNRTTDAIAEATAKKHGLLYDNGGVPSKQIAGKVYEQAQVKSTRKLTEWDLLVSLAQAEDRQVYVVGKTLYYVPTNPDDDPATGPAATRTLWWDPNGEAPSPLGHDEYLLDDLKVAHYAQFSHDIKVVVYNHDPHTGTISSITYGAAEYAADQAKKRRGGHKPTHKPSRRAPHRQQATMSAPAIGQKEVYNVSVHGKTPQQALDIAYARYKEISKHELVATVSFDGEPAIGIRDVFALKGTETLADTLYRAKKLSLAFKSGKGSTYSLMTSATLTNHAPMPTGEAI